MTPEDKSRIEEDEIIREKIRRVYSEKPKTLFGRFTGIVNSSLFIWFLSTFVANYLVTKYADEKSKFERREKELATINRLETEIAFRIQKVEHNLEPV